MLFLAITLGYFEYISALIISAIVHELSHISTARMLGLKTIRIVISGLGLCAIIQGLNYTSFYNKIIIILSGPAANLIIAICAHIMSFDSISTINICMCVFNLLPICPLDGGRILKEFLGLFTGDINSSRILNKIGRICSMLLTSLGLVMLILFPFNVTILFLGIYLHKLSAKEYLNSISAFYISLIHKNSHTKNRALNIKYYLVLYNYNIKNMINLLNNNRYIIFLVMKENKTITVIHEYELIEHTLKFGLHGCALDINKKL